MAFSVGNGIWNGVFAVPNSIADQHLKLASGLSIKVLLLLLRHDGNMELKEMAEQLSQSMADIQDAVNYWVGHGVLIVEEEPPPTIESPTAAAIQPVTVQLTPTLQYQEVQPEPSAPQEPSRQTLVTISHARQRLTTQQINEMGKQDKNIVYLLQETQSVLGKPLTPVATDTVAALYSYYGMQPDMILMLIHYCVSIGKDNMRYIEKVASDWLERGVDSHEKAEAEIVRLSQKECLENKIKASFGIYDRSLVTSEKKYIRTWLGEYKIDLALIILAYERTVEIKGKLSFPYINGILSNWHSKGITTTTEAMKEIREKQKTAPQKSQQNNSSYDIGELENMINYGDL